MYYKLTKKNKRLIRYIEKKKYKYKIDLKNKFIILLTKPFNYLVRLKKATFYESFDFGGTNLGKDERFKTLFSYIPDNLLMNFRKIYFLQNKRDFFKFFIKHPFWYAYAKNKLQGFCVRSNNDIYINLPNIKKFTLEYFSNKEDVSVWEFNTELSFCTLDTIIHELIHSVRNNPLNDYSEEKKAENSVVLESLETTLAIKDFFCKKYGALHFVFIKKEDIV